MKKSNPFISLILIVLTVLILTGGFILHCTSSERFSGPDMRTGSIFDFPEKPIDRTQPGLVGQLDDTAHNWPRKRKWETRPLRRSPFNFVNVGCGIIIDCGGDYDPWLEENQ